MKTKQLLMSLATAAAVAVMIPTIVPAQVLKKAELLGRNTLSTMAKNSGDSISMSRPSDSEKNNVWELPCPKEQARKFRKVKAPASVEVVPPEKPLYFSGFLQYSMVNGNMVLDYGLYKFNTADGLKREKLADVDWCINQGGAYYNHRLHGISNIPLPYDGGDGRVYYTEYDEDTWTPMPKNGLDVINNKFAMSGYKDIDYNTVDGMCYGFTSGGTLHKFDYETNVCETVVSTDYYVAAFAINSKGVGYMISENELYKVDLQTGDITSIGVLDINTSNVMQSMTFDPETDRLYYAANVDLSDGVSDPEPGSFFTALLEIDTETAKTTVRGIFPEDEEYLVLHFIDMPADDAPAELTDLSIQYKGDTNDGSISFTMPGTTCSGNSLSGDISYRITVNDDEENPLTGYAKAGSRVETDVTVKENGRNKIVAVLSNGSSKGIRNAIESWAGNDTPMAKDITFTYDAASGKADICWVLGAKNGGYVDPSAVTYTVVRCPDNVTIAENITATSISDNVNDVSYGGYYYSVTPFVNGEKGVTAGSNVIKLGKALYMPYFEDFENENAADAYTVIDANNDGTTWGVNEPTIMSGMLCYNRNRDKDADDWALTPPLHFEEGYVYNVKFTACGVMPDYPEKLTLYLGEGDDVDKFIEIMPETSICANMMEPINAAVNASVTHDGDYHVAFRCTSPASSRALFVDNLEIKRGPHVLAPKAVSNLSVTPGSEGDLSAVIEFDTPSLNCSDEALTKLSKIIVMRGEGNEIVETIDNPGVGVHMTVVDNDAVNGNITYYVNATNEYGESENAEISTYIGTDAPTSPTGIKIYDNLDGTATIEWEAPTVGQHNGYVDPDELLYSVFVYDSEEGLTQVVYDTDENSAIVDIPQSGVQKQMFFYVKAANELGKSELAHAPSIKVGTPYPMPFVEGFVMGNLSGLWISDMIENESAEPSIFEGETIDGDNSLAGAVGYEEGSWASLTSANISIGNAEKPMLVFSRMTTPGIDNTLKVIIRKNGGPDLKTVLTLNDKTSSDKQTWEIVKYDLSEYKEAKYIDVKFLFEFNDLEYPYVLIDDVNFCDVKDHDVAVAVKAPYHASVGQVVPLDITVHNVGDKATSPFTVNVYVDGVLADGISFSDPISSFMRAKNTVDYTVAHSNDVATEVWAEVVYDRDMNAENDYSEYVAMKVVPSLYNRPEDLTASKDEVINLEWSAPNPDNIVTESFEGYASFMTAGFGDWTTVDNDLSQTATINGFSFPHSGEAFAFMTFDFEALGVGNPLYNGHSGTQVALSMMNYSPNDDWLISPELDGNMQTVTMYVRAINGYMSNMFNILYSTTGNSIADFTNVVYSGELPYGNEDWTEYSVELPAGATYFAVQNTGNKGGMFMVDDITYTGKPLTLNGYNVYRDSELIGNTAADVTSFRVEAIDGQHVYNVTAVYAEGESGFSNGVTIDTSGVMEIGADAAIDDNTYDLSGRRMPADRKLEKGVYIRNHKKVIVK